MLVIMSSILYIIKYALILAAKGPLAQKNRSKQSAAAFKVSPDEISKHCSLGCVHMRRFERADECLAAVAGSHANTYLAGSGS